MALRKGERTNRSYMTLRCRSSRWALLAPQATQSDPSIHRGL
eukprot:CAMPEP_0203905024 /NCGR_PEP_ID=MMETSP0359-20131031/46762_1 /ASSEMBLY_ACC=CAM_ASM_000338 /TAXON_ID=268821 /ORGANISM="Scrippsiella Hangoei, Strain SHTV-5" /LENGTH=41 /DNA_ID= /DNA_START= /DNA_END= /DNA_ORIENTATION=